MDFVRRVRNRLATASRSRESHQGGGIRQSTSRKRARRERAISAPAPRTRRLPQPYQPVTIQTIDRRNQMVREEFRSPKHVGPWFSRQRYDTSERLGGDVVLYRLPTEVNQNTGSAVKMVHENAVAEIALMKELQGPNVPVVYDAFDDGNGHCFYSREFCTLTIEDLIEKNILVSQKPSVRQKQVMQSITLQILGALARLKQHGYVHTALEPCHFLLQTLSESFTGLDSLSPGDQVKLIGFSSVRPADPSKCSKAQLEEPSYIDNDYQAPEIQGLGNHKNASFASDVFAAGRVLDKLVGGNPSAYDRHLARLVRSMTAVKPEHRPTPEAARGFPYIFSRLGGFNRKKLNGSTMNPAFSEHLQASFHSHAHQSFDVFMGLNPLPEHCCREVDCRRFFDRTVAPHHDHGAPNLTNDDPIEMQIDPGLPRTEKNNHERYYGKKAKGFGISGRLEMPRRLYTTRVTFCPKCRKQRLIPKPAEDTEPTAYFLGCADDTCKYRKEIDYSQCISAYDLYLKDDGDPEQLDENFGHSWMQPLREKDYDHWKSAELSFASEHVRKIKGLHFERGNARLAPRLGQMPQLEPGIRRLKPGNVLILNQTYAGHAVLQREFAVEDVDTIDALFRDMDFDVRIPTNARGQRIVDFTEDQLHAHLDRFVRDPCHHGCEAAYVFLIAHGDMFDGIPNIGWLTDHGRPRILPLTDLLDYMQVRNRGWAIEECSARFFFVISCSGANREVAWYYETAREASVGPSASTASLISAIETPRHLGSTDLDRTLTDASRLTEQLLVSSADASRLMPGTARAPAAGTSRMPGVGISAYLQQAKEKYAAGKLSEEDKKIIEEKRLLKKKVAELPKGGPEQESSTSGTLIAFSSFQGFSSVELGRSTFVIEMDRLFRDAVRRRLSMQVLLDLIGKEVARYRYYDFEYENVVQQTPAYISRLHREYFLPPLRTEEPQPPAPKRPDPKTHLKKPSTGSVIRHADSDVDE